MVLVAGASSCADKTTGDAVVRIGGEGIDAALLEHWTSVIAHGAVVQGPAPRAAQTARQRALSFLIWSAWVTGEVAARGTPVSTATVEKGLHTQEAGFPSKAEFEEFLKTNGETSADVRFEIKTELATAALHRIATSDKPVLAPAAAAIYYRHHKDLFTIDETREFEIVHHHSFSVARKLEQEAQQKHAFPRGTSVLNELLTRSHFLHTTPDKRAIEKAIFAAGPNAAGGPVKLLGAYSVFLMTKISPRRLKPLAAVQDEIEERLLAAKHKQAFSAFMRSWVKRWKATTDCRSGQLIEMCSQSPAVPALPELEAALAVAGGASEAPVQTPSASSSG